MRSHMNLNSKLISFQIIISLRSFHPSPQDAGKGEGSFEQEAQSRLLVRGSGTSKSWKKVMNFVLPLAFSWCDHESKGYDLEIYTFVFHKLREGSGFCLTTFERVHLYFSITLSSNL